MKYKTACVHKIYSLTLIIDLFSVVGSGSVVLCDCLRLDLLSTGDVLATGFAHFTADHLMRNHKKEMNHLLRVR